MRPIHPLAVLSLSLVATLALFAPALGVSFLSDDFHMALAVREDGPLSIWSGRQGEGVGFFRPVVSLAHYMDYRLWGAPRDSI